MRHCLCLIGIMLCLSACSVQPAISNAQLQDQVIQTERAFAKSMADRNLAAFSNFISSEAVFFSDDKAIRGHDAVVAAWTELFKDSAAPFSWSPDHVEVLDSGNLALSTGPVMNPKGEVTMRFTSIWQREKYGEWRIIFDKGNAVCH